MTVEGLLIQKAVIHMCGLIKSPPPSKVEVRHIRCRGGGLSDATKQL